MLSSAGGREREVPEADSIALHEKSQESSSRGPCSVTTTLTTAVIIVKSVRLNIRPSSALSRVLIWTPQRRLMGMIVTAKVRCFRKTREKRRMTY